MFFSLTPPLLIRHFVSNNKLRGRTRSISTYKILRDLNEKKHKSEIEGKVRKENL